MNNNTFVHKYIRSLISKNDIVCDMTCGNGNDTLFLSQLAGKVYTFDISAQAIEKTAQRTAHTNNVILINDSHENIDQYIKEKIRLFIFNLGYLPHSDTPSFTRPETTLTAFQKALALTSDEGYIIITFYLGQTGGKDEYYLLKKYIEQLKLNVLEIYKQDKAVSPVTYIIRK